MGCRNVSGPIFCLSTLCVSELVTLAANLLLKKKWRLQVEKRWELQHHSGFMRHCCRALVPSMLAYWGKIELHKRIFLHREISATNQYFKTQILSLWLSNINDNNERMRERLHFLARAHKSKHEVSFSLRRSILLSALAGSLFGRCLERAFRCLPKTLLVFLFLPFTSPPKRLKHNNTSGSRVWSTWRSRGLISAVTSSAIKATTSRLSFQFSVCLQKDVTCKWSGDQQVIN